MIRSFSEAAIHQQHRLPPDHKLHFIPITMGLLLLLLLLLPCWGESSTRAGWFRRYPQKVPVEPAENSTIADGGSPQWVQRGDDDDGEDETERPFRSQRPSSKSQPEREEKENQPKENRKKEPPKRTEQTEDDPEPNPRTKPDTPKRRGFFGRLKPASKEVDESTEEDENEEKLVDEQDDEETAEEDEAEEQADQETEDSKESDSTNTDKDRPETEEDEENSDDEPEKKQSPQSQSEQQKQQNRYQRRSPYYNNPYDQQPQGVIVIGPRPQNNPFQQQPHGMPSPLRPDASALAELVSTVISTASRWWFLTWVARRMAHFEDAIIPTQQYVWERLNDRFDRDTLALKNVLRKPPSKLRPLRWKQAIRRFQGRKPPQRRILANLFRRTVVVIPLNTGRSSDADLGLDELPEVVSFLMRQQDSHAFGTDKTTGEPLEMEVVFVVESPGGSATAFGKAAAHVGRLREHPYITTTVCVDEIAASGGYMIASQVDRILAAPFAILGSIGVIREGFNFYEAVKRYGVQPLVLKAGQNKNPLSTFGPVSRGDIEAEQVRLRKMHAAFQDLVGKGRPMLSTSTMDGSVFLGEEALNLGLVDGLITSEEYLHERIEYGDRVLKLHRAIRRRNRRLSPFDIIPYLQRNISSFMAKFAKDQDNAVVTMVQAGAWIGFLRHLVCKYGPLLLNNSNRYQ